MDPAEVDLVVLIVAAGRGRRAGGGAPKQYRPLGRSGAPAVRRAADAFRAAGLTRIAVAVHPDDAPAAAALLGETARLLPVRQTPETTRQDTVRAALEQLAAAAPSDWVAIHDAARPFIPPDAIQRAVAAALETGAASAALPVVDTLRREAPEGAGRAGAIAPRDGLWRAQTPQIFRLAPLLAAHRAEATHPATDDVEIARRAGLAVALSLGHEDARKITTPDDLIWADAEAARRDAAASAREQEGGLREFRTGQGFDVHKFGPNADGSTDHVMLCGVAVPHETGLVGHSDADVGLHALTDAVLGAGALGDIGRHFPPSDPTWRGAASDQFLAHAAQLLGAAGARLAHVDVTLICERPKIGPHAEAMRARIAEILALDMARVSVKATTTEGLGFTGRREGIAAMATATALFEESQDAV